MTLESYALSCLEFRGLGVEVLGFRALGVWEFRGFRV